MKTKISSLPKWAKVDHIDIDDLVKNIDELKQLMKYVFLRPVSTTITIAFETDKVATIVMEAQNPANCFIWNQSFNIYKDGRISVYGGQEDASWCWKVSYFNKCIRIIRYWLSETGELGKSRIRVQERNSIVKLELIRHSS